jgi:hypothetical protein
MVQPKSANPLEKAGLKLDLLQPGVFGHDITLVEQHIREGQFQRSLALITAFSSLMGGLEVAYEHYRGSYSQRVMYTPVIISGLLTIVSFTSIFSRKVARTLLPLTACVMLVDGLAGFIFHIRGIARKPGGWRIPLYNLIMGPPVLAPLLLGISGFLGVVTAFLRREDDLAPTNNNSTQVASQRPPGSRMTPWGISSQHRSLAQDIREGRFQRLMAVAAALSIVFSGFEAWYSHYKNNFKLKIQWTPILLTPVLFVAGIGSIWSRTLARTLLPVASVLALVDGLIGTFYHARNILEQPGGLKLPLYNLMYGSPILAPLLLAASGFLGLLASLLRRGDD